jgi:transcriptional regulator with XRE-family HTH domain
MGLVQRELAARVRFEDGHPISAPYLNDLEHDLRKPPRAYLIEQFAQGLGVNPDMLFYLAGRLPDDLRSSDLSDEEVIAAFQMLRQTLEKRNDRTAPHLRREIVFAKSNGVRSY